MTPSPNPGEVDRRDGEDRRVGPPRRENDRDQVELSREKILALRHLNRTLRRYLVAAGVVISVLAAYVIVGNVRIYNNSQRLDKYSLAECLATRGPSHDSLRYRTNAQGYIIFASFYSAADRLKERIDNSSGDAKRLNQEAYDTYKVLFESLGYTPAADCKAFLRDPKNYQLPAPRPFTDLGIKSADDLRQGFARVP